MNLSVSPRPDGRKYLSIVKAYRRKETGQPTSKTVLSLGYLDVLEKDYEDPIAHFREVAKRMTEEEGAGRTATLGIDMDEELPEGALGTKNLGYAAILKVYHELGIHGFLNARSRKERFKFNANSVMTLLAVSRILAPGSKKKAHDGRGRYFERFAFTDDDIYHALTWFDRISTDLQRHIHDRVKARYGSDTSIVYYDVTNYYFEISKPDELRRYTKNAKQKRKKPVVQMGLAMDRDGVPLHYGLFPGNRLDKETFRSVIGEVRKNYGTGRIVAVADMGIVTGDNIHYLVGDKPERPANGYVFSFSVRGGTDDFKKYVLDPEGYAGADGMPADGGADFMVKSRHTRREINVTMGSGRTRKTKHVYEKQVVFWSRKYCLKARAERAEMVAKAEALIADPGKYTKATSYGAADYVKGISFDRSTGEVLDEGRKLELRLDKIAEEERYDGYYSIVTSEHGMGDWDIIDTYRGLWEIEETFKVTKGDLMARPVYLSDHGHINAHFLSCFIALTILRIIQKKTGKLHSAAAIIECLNKIECINEQGNIYLFGYRSALSDEIGDALGINFRRRRMRLSEIKGLLGEVKK
ncbi:MAG: IS1634 family transposase [Clostridiales Family XIII bacterium]|jgi:hypothetical protein|nr:IS1634 family transposase [Clostridiales Family XIII bacterium]